jgi:hypothetical protein
MAGRNPHSIEPWPIPLAWQVGGPCGAVRGVCGATGAVWWGEGRVGRRGFGGRRASRGAVWGEGRVGGKGRVVGRGPRGGGEGLRAVCGAARAAWGDEGPRAACEPGGSVGRRGPGVGGERRRAVWRGEGRVVGARAAWGARAVWGYGPCGAARGVRAGRQCGPAALNSATREHRSKGIGHRPFRLPATAHKGRAAPRQGRRYRFAPDRRSPRTIGRHGTGIPRHPHCRKRQFASSDRATRAGRRPIQHRSMM